MPHELLVPHPSALIQSMRSIGYRPATAIADLVDNSISAQAKLIQIELQPAIPQEPGWIRVVDDGHGMTRQQLTDAMRWGKDQKGPKRAAHDLGRFGLGLKTASFSLGRRLTVLTSDGNAFSACRWDLDHIEETGRWELLDGINTADAHLIFASQIASRGTVILISNVDRFRLKNKADSFAPILKDISEHLGLVFHRFLKSGANSLNLRVGPKAIGPINLFNTSSKSTEELTVDTENLAQGTVSVKTIIMPTYRMLVPEEYERLKGPKGWLAHQGFFIYRADRLIVPGGWLGFMAPEEHHKLARIIVDLPNDQDEAWGLNVAKSKVSPPAALRGDLERIAFAAKKMGIERYRMHGEKVAPLIDDNEEILGQTVSTTAFWRQRTDGHTVNFKINRDHPLVHALYSTVENSDTVNAFLRAFEKLLPIPAILQNPFKTTNGLDSKIQEEELTELLKAAQMVYEVFCATGHTEEQAKSMTMACQPFSRYQSALSPMIASISKV